ncbi:MAG: restriction endonuclease [Clostridiales bacterium]|nr:restriction endonuclease [Clostridiales bacterium]
MIDFKELDERGDDFELLVRELLNNKGLEVYWSGKGPDGGKDLLCIERCQSNFKGFSRRWLVQCKHNAHSGKAVGTADLGVIENSCALHNADGYILVCTTYPSSTVVETLEGIERNKKIITTFWDYRALERQLLVPENWSLVNRFFPKSAKQLDWQISMIDSDFWHASYKGNGFYFALRIGTNYDHYLKYISDRLDAINMLKLPKGHYIRVRAVYFDDKYTQFTLYIDYLLPQSTSKENFELPEKVRKVCTDYIGGFYCNMDLKIYDYNEYSDNFDVDHRDYYVSYIPEFRTGMSRKKGYFNTIFKDDPRKCTEEIKSEAFNALLDAFKQLTFVTILNAKNASVESLKYFSDNFSWRDTIEGLNYQPGNFFDVDIRFECEQFDKLCELLSTFPTSVDQHFELEQHHIFLPEEGYDKDENALYTLRIMVHPAIGVSQLQFRQYLNEYMREITKKIIEFQK